uniref:Amidohydrolase-related domain-containing protein n=1 Tax=Bionectria ochroleuca TaxID=29856 RepID=A0A8H7KCG4_BIOOC
MTPQPTHHPSRTFCHYSANRKKHKSAMLQHSQIPPGSWDSHMHVFDVERYPLLAKALYAPKPYTVADAITFEASMGLDGVVIVQPSGYGNDNSCLLDALRQLGPRNARGVVGFDPTTTSPETLREWHGLGIRGVRVNLRSIEWSPTEAELTSVLRAYADLIRPLDWVLQIYVPLPTVKTLEKIIPELGIRFCIDHIGHPPLNESGLQYAQTRNPYDLDGFASLIRLLQGKQTYVKLSAAYRFSQATDYEDVAPIAEEVLRVAGRSRVVFATDWPHSRYEGLDISPWVQKVLEWCDGDKSLVERVFRDNARDLWDIRN